MLSIECEGSPREIGLTHGRIAKDQIRCSIRFYEQLFREKTSLSWPEICQVARKFMPVLADKWTSYLDEMQGVAEGSGQDFDDILALNVRTEIAYGMFNDGCTALSWKSQKDENSFLAQNWDWQHEQKGNLISMTIYQAEKPAIHMMTEAGIIGKIGLNSSGVGVTLNAIKAKGVDFQRLPCHLALRTVLESQSREAAVARLEDAGVASACHILVADPTGGVGLECSAKGIVSLPMTNGIVTHTNHYIGPTDAPESKMAFPDSPFRLARVRELIHEAGSEPSVQRIENILKDEKNYPCSICRAETKDSTVATLFSVVMDLKRKAVVFKLGRPVHPEATIVSGDWRK
ncbi:MAG: hypothetical protein Q9227_007444 [Pyrenula ochraceoflavens]